MAAGLLCARNFPSVISFKLLGSPALQTFYFREENCEFHGGEVASVRPRTSWVRTTGMLAQGYQTLEPMNTFFFRFEEKNINASCRAGYAVQWKSIFLVSKTN